MTPSSIRFLVVDDMATVRRIIIALLELLGHTGVAEADNGAEALAMLRARADADPVDFVITDWNMPVMNGLDLIRAMRAEAVTRDIPVLMISSELSEENVCAAMDAGVDSYLSKFALSAGLLDEQLKHVLARRPIGRYRQPQTGNAGYLGGDC